MDALKKLRILNGNTLKLIAAAFMLVDHLGMIFFPRVAILRAIGRLAMPMFAFMISEGCRYTKNKWKHFLLLFGLGAICQVVYYFFDPTSIYFGILITFSLSTLMIYALQFAKKCFFDDSVGFWKTIGAVALFFGLVLAVYIFTSRLHVDYGFFGAMIPVFASIFDFRGIPAPDLWKKFDILPIRILCMLLPMLMIVITHTTPLFPLPSLLAIPILLLYSGEKGKLKMKYFFYIFYPAHLAILEGLYMLIYVL
jgi:hypothetical protein